MGPVRRFFGKIVLFLLPFLGITLVEIYVLPIDFSTFRLWEALRTHTLRAVLPGYFYPNLTVTKVETGDLAPHSPYGTKKKVTWVTDRLGYRNVDPPGTRYRVVVIGDSNVAGSSLTQDEILSEVLARRLGAPVYAITPASINTFLKDLRFQERPPDVVVIASIEREIPYLRRAKKELVTRPWYERAVSYAEFRIKANPVVQAVAVPIDRVFKANLLHFTRAGLRRGFAEWFTPLKGLLGRPRDAGGSAYDEPLRRGSLLFLQGAKANEDVPVEKLQETIRVLRSYGDVLKSRGIRFIFLPIPNKENIYHQLLPVTKRPTFLAELIPALNGAGVETVDTQKAFDEAREKGVLVFHPDDTHWNGNGVRISADLLAGKIGLGPHRKKLLAE